MAQFESAAEQEQRHACERYQLQNRQNRHNELIAAEQRAVDERNRFFARHGEYLQLPGQFLFADGARFLDNGYGIDPPKDPRQLLLYRRTFLRAKLNNWIKQYSDQCAYVRDALTIQKMNSGPGPQGPWRTELPKFADLILALKREIEEIERELTPESTTPTLREVNRAEALEGTRLIATLPTF